MIPKKKSKLIVKDANGNLIQLLPEVRTDTELDAESSFPVSSGAIAEAIGQIESSLQGSDIIKVMDFEPTAANTADLEGEGMIAWLQPEVDSWSITINTELAGEGGKTGQIPFNLYAMHDVFQVDDASITVDWGDGTVEVHTSTDAVENKFIMHEYDEPGTYTIVMSGRSFENLYIYGTALGETNAKIYRDTLTAVNSAFPKLAGIYGSLGDGDFSGYSRNSFEWCFGNCFHLRSIPADLFVNNKESTSFSHCFHWCSSMQSIPEGLFDGCSSATDFYGCFSNCGSISSIPSGLFDDCTSATNFHICFYYCSSITSIPAGLFDSCIDATQFLYCFSDCTSLASIPERLFEKNTSVDDFYSCFWGCTALGSFTLHIGSPDVEWCSSFVTQKAGTTRTIYVPASSTTYANFSSIASSLGLTIVEE